MFTQPFKKMKFNLVVLALFLQTLAFSQVFDKFAEFSAQKQVVALRTGINMKYSVAGNPNGVPVILIHGYTDSGRSFQFLMNELAKEAPHLRIIAPDLRGHGDSSMPDSAQCAQKPEDCFSIASFSADIIALMDQLGIGKAHLVGHSMGSLIAQEMALKYSGRVKTVVLIGTFINGKENAGIHQFLIKDMLEGVWKTSLEKRAGFRWPADAWSVTPHDLGLDVESFLKENWVFDPVADDDFVAAILPETCHTPLGTWIGAIKSIGKTDNRETLKNLKKPTLVLWATQDNFFPEQPDQEEMKRVLRATAQSNGVRVIYKTYGKSPLPESGVQTNDVGHNLHWGAPKEVAADIASFIKTGFPKDGLPYANPEHIKQILVEDTNSGISVWGKTDNQ